MMPDRPPEKISLSVWLPATFGSDAESKV